MADKTELHALVLGSFPPRECGIATFTKDVVDSLTRVGVPCDVVAIDEPGSDGRMYGPQVAASLKRDDPSSYEATAAFINAHPASVLLVQHEFGLFGGEDGDAFLALLAAVRKPVVIVLHTILTAPRAHHRAVTRRLCARADAIVVLSHTGKDILKQVYAVNEAAIHIIPHGVPDVAFLSTTHSKRKLGLSHRKVISTFGLLSRGKGLEDAIRAMSMIVARHPDALYLILGQTHPLVRQTEGESYRESLRALVTAHGLKHNVDFVDRYLSFEDLVAYLSASDIYLTPYLNADQIVSGTLAYALGCGKAIVSTPYLHAREVLAQDRGRFCNFRDPVSIAAVVTTLLDHPQRRRAMELRAYRYGHEMRWSNVAASYSRLFRDVIGGNVSEIPARPRAFEQPLRMLASTAFS
ncbi:MAG: glycosyltransferase family 4 protein [Candidatus Eremiobacteraeota bacterium]|nr:glycosyltransferase family 4 protein [Candidatus Eremiobacteraeota bacterium]